MQSCDVLIVGGGPAGSTCAWKLRQAGLDVVVLDKAEFPRHKICAGWITPNLVTELQLDPDAYRQERVWQPISGFRAGCVGRGAVEIRYGQTVSYGIRRCEFDDYLLRRCGARLALGQPLESLRRENGGWIVNEAFRAPMLVGAGGHFCPVARHLGHEPGAVERVVAAQEIEFAMDAAQQAQCRVAADTPELYFCDDLEGYGWCFRKGDFLNVGLGRMDRQKIAAHVGSFVAWLQELGRIPRPLPEKLRGHAYYGYHESPRKLLDDGVLLLGDAAGLAYSESGEGIRPAIESGLMAARVLAACGGDFGRRRLEAYRQLIQERFGRRRGARLPDASWRGRLRRRIGQRLLGNRWFLRHLVLDRWFLHRHQPAWH